jgi:hypothetical protein
LVSITVANFTASPPEKIIKLVENIRLPSDNEEL